MKKSNFSDFEVVALKEDSAANILGGECTGGGFQLIGDGVYVQWESDETNGGCTTFEGVSICR